MMSAQRQHNEAPHGAYTDLPRLLEARYLARQLDLHTRNAALALLAGQQSSSRRGRGLDFDEVRKYYPGDDVRSIDWRVTARTTDPHTKVFREERERPVLIALDQRNSLFFGSKTCFKSVYAAELAAVLAWTALEGGDRVGGLISAEHDTIELRPKASRSAVLHFLQRSLEANRQLPNRSPSTAMAMTQQLVALRRIARPGSHLILISDFADYSTDADLKHLSSLARHNRITVCFISDPLELQAPRAGVYPFTDGSSTGQLDTTSKTLSEAYELIVKQRLQTLQTDCRGLGIPVIACSTVDPIGKVLRPLFGGSR